MGICLARGLSSAEIAVVKLKLSPTLLGNQDIQRLFNIFCSIVKSADQFSVEDRVLSTNEFANWVANTYYWEFVDSVYFKYTFRMGIPEALELRQEEEDEWTPAQVKARLVSTRMHFGRTAKVAPAASVPVDASSAKQKRDPVVQRKKTWHTTYQSFVDFCRMVERICGVTSQDMPELMFLAMSKDSKRRVRYLDIESLHRHCLGFANANHDIANIDHLLAMELYRYASKRYNSDPRALPPTAIILSDWRAINAQTDMVLQQMWRFQQFARQRFLGEQYWESYTKRVEKWKKRESEKYRANIALQDGLNIHLGPAAVSELYRHLESTRVESLHEDAATAQVRAFSKARTSKRLQRSQRIRVKTDNSRSGRSGFTTSAFESNTEQTQTEPDLGWRQRVRTLSKPPVAAMNRGRSFSDPQQALLSKRAPPRRLPPVDPPQ